MQNIKLNQQVQVTLTEAGAYILNKTRSIYLTPYIFKAGDVYKVQLCNLMSTFGPHMHNTWQCGFVDSMVQIVDTAVKENPSRADSGTCMKLELSIADAAALITAIQVLLLTAPPSKGTERLRIIETRIYSAYANQDGVKD